MTGFDLKISRVIMGLTQAKLAEKIGYTQQGVSYMEKGTSLVPVEVEMKVQDLLREWKNVPIQ